MAITSTATVLISLTGEGFGPNPTLSEVSAPTSASPPPGSFTLQAGVNTLLMPTGFTFSKVTLQATPNSSNTKTVKGASGDTGLAGWTGDWVTLPASSGTSVVILSAGIETLKAIYS